MRIERDAGQPLGGAFVGKRRDDQKRRFVVTRVGRRRAVETEPDGCVRAGHGINDAGRESRKINDGGGSCELGQGGNSRQIRVIGAPKCSGPRAGRPLSLDRSHVTLARGDRRVAMSRPAMASETRKTRTLRISCRRDLYAT